MGIAELNAHFTFNHNAIRQHLAKLVAAGLVVEAKAASGGPGRPRLVYAPDPAAEGRWGDGGPYERLSRLLVEIIRTGDTPVEVGRRAARELRVASPSGDIVADAAAAMARQGFEPEVRPTRGGAEITLHHCPFESAASADRPTVCSLHLGIGQGLVEGSSYVVEELVAKDPRQADCRLRLHVSSEGEDEEAGKLTIRRRARRG